MSKNENIHIKIELCKDKNSGNLTLMTYFDPNAPNFSKDKDGFFWVPTVEEKDFLNEVFELIPEHQMKNPSSEKNMTEPLEKREEPTAPEPQPQVDMENKQPATPQPQPDMEKKEPEQTSSPFEKQEQQSMNNNPHFENKEETTPEMTEEEPKPNQMEYEMKDQSDKVLVEADDLAIDRALKKGGNEDGEIVEADEHTIVEKVLSQKKKGRWSRGN